MYIGMKSFNNNGAGLNSSLGHLDRTGFAGDTASRQAKVQQEPESSWSGRNAPGLSGTQAASGGVDAFERPNARPPSPARSPLAASLELMVQDNFSGSFISLPSVAGLSTMLKAAGLRPGTDLGDPGLAAPLRAIGERYREGDVRRELLDGIARGDRAALAELMKKRGS